MQTNKTLSIGLLVAVGLCIVAWAVEDASLATADVFYLLGGLGLMVFGIWLPIRILRGRGCDKGKCER